MAEIPTLKIKSFTLTPHRNTAGTVSPSLSPIEALRSLKNFSSKLGWVDVRSEGEFKKGALPGTVNLPILKDDHRHQVGLTFKTKGQEAAVALGHQLVGPEKIPLVDQWRMALKNQERPLLFCWRGGLRSQISQQWLAEAGIPAQLVEGGYKNLRNHLLEILGDLPPFLVVSGPTGSHKTQLLLELPRESRVDLEGLAHHRGSAFGLELGAIQPTQATFENALLLELYRRPKEIFVEDESRLIGTRSLPLPLYSQMSQAPRIILTASLEQRTENIVNDYILGPLKERPADRQPLENYFSKALGRIKSRLGGLLYGNLLAAMENAFQNQEGQRRDLHQLWVSQLLELYYDKAYNHSFQRTPRKVIFRGDYQACKEWALERWSQTRS